MFQKHYRTHTHDLYKELNQDNKDENVQIANLVYKDKQNMLPQVFDEYFTHGNEIQNHITRTSLNLHIKQPHNENGKKILKYQGPHIFNKLPKSIVNSHSFHTF